MIPTQSPSDRFAAALSVRPRSSRAAGVAAVCIVTAILGGPRQARAEEPPPAPAPAPSTIPAPSSGATLAAPDSGAPVATGALRPTTSAAEAAAAGPAASEAPAPVAALTVKSVPEMPGWVKSLSVGGGAIVYYYQPVDLGGVKNNIDLFFANLLLDGNFGPVSLHIEPRFRDTKLRPFFTGPSWVQEVYASFKLASNLVIKAGKAYSHFGLFWDNSFYGNVQVYDGLKLDPDYGLSLEGTVNPNGPGGLRYYAQYFVVDGQTNVSLQGRDTISIPGARRRNQAIARVEPFFKPSDGVILTGGLSGEFLQASLPVGTKDVYRAAVDATLGVKQWSLWAEYSYQNGQTVTDFPVAGTPATATTPAVPGQASSHNHYALAGTQYTWRALTLRYNASTGRYRDLSISEWMHVPALAVAAGDNVTVLAEFVDWRRYAPGGHIQLDRSINITLNGHF
jgi:hypothetical protein